MCIPAWMHYEAKFIKRYGRPSLRSSISRVPGRQHQRILNHIQALEPVSVAGTNAIWHGTMIVDEDGKLCQNAMTDINAPRLRT